jgi:uncharacterized protein
MRQGAGVLQELASSTHDTEDGKAFGLRQSSGAFDHDSAFRVGPSPTHGLGLFAQKSFASGERVVQYTGQPISKAESLRRCSEGNQFIFYLDEQHDLDGSTDSNPAGFINHSCSPNCSVELIDGQLCVIATRDIAPGEELSFDYGYDLSDYRNYPCSCGAPNCVGYIVAEELREAICRPLLSPNRPCG